MKKNKGNLKENEEIKESVEKRFVIANKKYKISFPKLTRWFNNLDHTSWLDGFVNGLEFSIEYKKKISKNGENKDEKRN